MSDEEIKETIIELESTVIKLETTMTASAFRAYCKAVYASIAELKSFMKTREEELKALRKELIKAERKATKRELNINITQDVKHTD